MRRHLTVLAIVAILVTSLLPAYATDTDTVTGILGATQQFQLDHRAAIDRADALAALLGPDAAEIADDLIAEHYETRGEQLDELLYTATIQLQAAAAAGDPDAIAEAQTFFDVAHADSSAPPIPETLLTAPLDADPLVFANPATGDLTSLGASSGYLSFGAGVYCPVAGPVRFINDWGFPRSNGRTHKGLDMFGDRGTPVVAPMGGFTNRISYTEEGLGGITARMTDDQGTYWYLTHLDSIAPGVTPGMRVEAGQLLGFLGNTGNARTTPPHVHAQRHPNSGTAQPLYHIMVEACASNFSTAIQQG